MVSVTPEITAILPPNMYTESADHIASAIIFPEINTSMPSVTVTVSVSISVTVSVTVTISVTVNVSVSSSHAKKKSMDENVRIVMKFFIYSLFSVKFYDL